MRKKVICHSFRDSLYLGLTIEMCTVGWATECPSAVEQMTNYVHFVGQWYQNENVDKGQENTVRWQKASPGTSVCAGILLI